MTDFLLHLGWLTLSMSVLVLSVILFHKVFGERFLARSRYITWTVLIFSLCIGVGLFRLPALFTFEVQMPSFADESSEELPTQSEEIGGTVGTLSPTENPVQPSGGHTSTDTQNPAENPSPDVNPSTDIQAPPITNIGHSVEHPTESPVKAWLAVNIPTVIFAVWLIGAVVYFAVNFSLYIRITRRYAKNKIFCTAQIEELFHSMCKRYKIARIPGIYICPDVGSPMLYGYTKPTVLLPAIPFSENSLVSVLAHTVQCAENMTPMKSLSRCACPCSHRNILMH